MRVRSRKLGTTMPDRPSLDPQGDRATLETLL